MFEINHLHFSYGTNVIFDDFSFSINKGDILCISGKNGSGKTTLLKILCGLNYYPTLDCKIDGIYVSQHKLKNYVTYIPTSPNFYENLTATEYILWLESLWKKDESYIERVYDYMSLLNLEVDESSEIAAFSLGMKYKLYFCSFLALDNPVLLLDEPLNSLDIASREAAISLLKQYIQKHDGYCVFSSHVKDTISSLATTTIFI